MKFVFAILLALALAVLALALLRILDRRADRAEWDRLEALRPEMPGRFAPEMVADLPEPARRYFSFAIAEGTPLLTVVRIEMSGELSLGTKEDPRYQAMRAQQILAPPHGFVWQVRTGGAMRVTGSDAMAGSTSWSRFRLFDLIPIGRVAGDADHRRSSFGRMVGEGLFWTPAAFLPPAGPWVGAGWDDVRWEAVDADIAAVTVRIGDLEQSAEVHIDEEGRPSRVVFQRWSNENVDRVYRLQPFGGDLDAFEDFGGFRLPTRILGGNHYGTDDYHPFFVADVTEIRFPGAQP